MCLHMYVVSDILLITSVLASMPFEGKKLYEFLAVTKVDGLPPAPSFADFGSVENYVCKI